MSQANRILILGAGAGGLRVALGLDRLLIGRRESPVLLVDQHDCHQITPRLPDVVSGAASPASVVLPIRRLLSGRKVELLQATVERLDLPTRTIGTSAGPLSYRWLVVALGGQVATYGLPGVAEHALLLRTVEDAQRSHDAVGESYRQAAWKLEASEREALGTAVVGGAGFTGVEVAAALADRVRELATRYRLPAGVGRVVLVERAERVLPGYDRALADAAQAALRRKGVQLRLGVAMAGASAGEVSLATGESIRCGVFVWAGGVEASAVVRASGLPLGRNGRLVVDRQMRVPEHPGAYALGDVCAVLGEGINAPPPSAQLAVRQGDVVAHNVFAEIVGGEPREYRAIPQDVVVSLGRNDALAMVRGVVVSGWRAVALKRLAELRYLEAIGGPGGLVAGLRLPA